MIVNRSLICKKASTKLLLSMILLSSMFLIHPTQQLIKCKQSILNNFYLTGMPHSIYEPMHICPQVHDKCCSLGDEIKIKHLVEKHTQPILERRVALTMRSIGSILDSFMELVEIHPSLMVLHYSVPREVYFKEKICETLPRDTPDRIEQRAYYAYHNGVNKYVRKRSLDVFLGIKKKGWKKRAYLKLLAAHKRRQRNRRRRRRWLKQSDFYGPRKLRRRRKRKRSKKVKKPKFKHQKFKVQRHHYMNFSPFKIFNIHVSAMTTPCRIREEVMHRDFVIVNQEKVKYCYGLHDIFLDMNMKLFMKYLSNVQMSLKKIVGMKNTLYCSVCDAHRQHFFRENTKEIVLSVSFCNKFLIQEKDYFMFMHVILIEFINQVLQYLACYETDGRIFEFPFPSFMVKYTRRIAIVQKCLSSLNDKKNFMKNCYMICRQFSLIKFSAFFEGDLELLKRTNVSISSFLRKYRRGVNLQKRHDDKLIKKFGIKDIKKNKEIVDEIAIPENVDGVLLEPFGPHSGITNKKFYFNKDERLRQYKMRNTEKFSYYYDLNKGKDVKHIKNLKAKLIKAKNAKEKAKLKKLIAKLLAGKDTFNKGNFIPPKPKKFKLPLKKMVVGASGILDRLSTKLFQHNLKSNMYPQRGYHKFTKAHWKFRKAGSKYHKLKKKKKVIKKKRKGKKVKGRKSRRLVGSETISSRILARRHVRHKRRGRRVIRIRRKGRKGKKGKKGSSKKGSSKKGKKKPKKPTKKKKLKINYKVNDQINPKLVHKNYRDVISSPMKHAQVKKKSKYNASNTPPPSLWVENLNQIFEKSKAETKVMTFVHEYEEYGIDPLMDLDHVNWAFNTTTLIEKRFAIPEKINRGVMNQYMGVPVDIIKGFNNELEDTNIDDYDSMDEKLRDVKDLKLKLAVMTKSDEHPLELHKVQKEISRLEKALLENEANRKRVDKAMKAYRNRKGHSDLNHNKYPDYHHHFDLYYNDTFHGITHMFEKVFGS